MKKINIYTNDNYISRETERILKTKLDAAGYVTAKEFDPHAELLICIGGDGAFLRAMHKYEFPQMPIVGVNTGHLGFFQEFDASDLDKFITDYKSNNLVEQTLTTVKATITCQDGTSHMHRALNEISIKGFESYSIHLTMSIGESFIQRFSGDGLLVATPAGSTAYNYSLGGSIVDPRLELLQVTPIAPMNTTAYRSLTSSIMLPAELNLNIFPEMPENTSIMLVRDGNEIIYKDVDMIKIEHGSTKIQLLRSSGYDFWNKVKTKFL